MMMSYYGGQRLLVVNCCYCQTQIQLPSVSPIYLVGTSVRCRRCYASTCIASPGFASYYSSVPYYVPINPPPHAGFSSFHHSALPYHATINPLPRRGFPYSALDYNDFSLANDYSLLQSLSLATPSSAPEEVKANSRKSSTNGKPSPPSQTQITKDNKPEDDQKPLTIVSGNQVRGNTGDHNGSFSVGNTTQKHAPEKDKANSSNSSTNAKSIPSSQTQITKDEDNNGSFSAGNTAQKHASKKDKDNSSNSSTNAKSSPPSQTQITKDDKSEEDRKPCIVVSGNQVSGNTGDSNGSFSVGNTHKQVVVNIQ